MFAVLHEELDDFNVQLSVNDEFSEDSVPICMRAHEWVAAGKLLNNFVPSTVSRKTILFQRVIQNGLRIDSFRAEYRAIIWIDCSNSIGGSSLVASRRKNSIPGYEPASSVRPKESTKAYRPARKSSAVVWLCTSCSRPYQGRNLSSPRAQPAQLHTRPADLGDSVD